MVSIFRFLLIASTIIYSVYYWMPLFDEPFYSVEAKEVLALDGFGAAVVPGMRFATVFFCSWLAVRVLLFYFVRWARFGFALLCLGYPLFNLALGIRVVTPVELVILNFITLADGALLAIAYFTSVAPRFGANPQIQ